MPDTAVIYWSDVLYWATVTLVVCGILLAGLHLYDLIRGRDA